MYCVHFYVCLSKKEDLQSIMEKLYYPSEVNLFMFVYTQSVPVAKTPTVLYCSIVPMEYQIKFLQISRDVSRYNCLPV